MLRGRSPWPASLPQTTSLAREGRAAGRGGRAARKCYRARRLAPGTRLPSPSLTPSRQSPVTPRRHKPSAARQHANVIIQRPDILCIRRLPRAVVHPYLESAPTVAVVHSYRRRRRPNASHRHRLVWVAKEHLVREDIHSGRKGARFLPTRLLPAPWPPSQRMLARLRLAQPRAARIVAGHVQLRERRAPKQRPERAHEACERHHVLLVPFAEDTRGAKEHASAVGARERSLVLKHAPARAE